MKPSRRRSSSLALRILLAMAAGIVLGWVLGPKVAPLGEIGKALIQLIKTLAAPLLFFAVVDAIVRTEMAGKQAVRMVGVSLFNAALALGIGLGISRVLEPGIGLRSLIGDVAEKPPAPQGLDFAKVLQGYLPQSIVQPFADNSIIAIVLVAVLTGLGLRSAKRESAEGVQVLEQAVAGLFRVFESVLVWIVAWVPVAVFSVVAKTVGERGLAALGGLGPYLIAALVGLALQILIVYQGWLLALGIGLKKFWSGVREPAVYAMGASSSLATLPVTLGALDRMGVSAGSARLAACVGTNLNNDGILLYEAMAAIAVAQAYGIELGWMQQVGIVASCALAGIGIAGIPEAGLISLSLVLATAGLPVEILPALLTVDWILSRARATTNVISDCLVASVLDRFTAGRPGK